MIEEFGPFAAAWLDDFLVAIRMCTDETFRAAVGQGPNSRCLAEAKVVCRGCAQHPVVAEAYLYDDGDILVLPFRRLGRKALAERQRQAAFTESLYAEVLVDLGVDADEIPRIEIPLVDDWERTAQYPEDTVSSTESESVVLRCRQCKTPIDLVLDDLRDPLRVAVGVEGGRFVVSGAGPS